MTRTMPRDTQLFRLLTRAVWLTTTQIQYAIYPTISRKVLNKRLHKLTDAGFLKCERLSRTEDNCYRLTRQALLAFEARSDWANFPRGSKLPRNWEHFKIINDLRISYETELSDRLRFFFGDLEIRKLFPQSRILPDAIAAIRTGGIMQNIHIEVDLDSESLKYFCREKIQPYTEEILRSDSICGMNDGLVLVYTNNGARMRRLMERARACMIPQSLFYFARLPELPSSKFLERIYVDPCYNPKEFLTFSEVVSRSGVSRRQQSGHNARVFNRL